MFRLDLSGCFGEYDEEDGEDEVQDDFDHDGRFLGGGAAFFRGPSTNFFLGFALLLEDGFEAFCGEHGECVGTGCRVSCCDLAECRVGRVF